LQAVVNHWGTQSRDSLRLMASYLFQLTGYNQFSRGQEKREGGTKKKKMVSRK
jgi:hypothetical protein